MSKKTRGNAKESTFSGTKSMSSLIMEEKMDGITRYQNRGLTKIDWPRSFSWSFPNALLRVD